MYIPLSTIFALSLCEILIMGISPETESKSVLPSIPILIVCPSVYLDMLCASLLLLLLGSYSQPQVRRQ